MKYKADIEGMHCSGCEMLIKMSLEESNFTDINVSMKDKSVTFDSTEGLEKVQEILNGVFASFDDYKYSNLVLV